MDERAAGIFFLLFCGHYNFFVLTDPLGIRLSIQLKQLQRDRVPGGFLSMIVFKFQKLVVSQMLKIHMQRR